MSTEAQTIVVIQDASRDVGLKAIEKALKKLSVKAGDQLIIIAIFNWFSSPMGYMVSVDSSYFVSSNKKIISENFTKRKNDYHTNRYINKLSEYCQKNEIEFQLEVNVGPASQVISDAAAKFQPTTLILDKQIHRNMKNFVDRIPCGMYRITSDNSLEKLKDPKSTASKLSERQENISYSEMIPGSEEDGVSLQMSKSSSTDLFTSTGASSQCSTDVSTSSIASSQYVLQKYQIGEFFPEQEKQGRQSLFHISGIQETRQTEVIHREEDFTIPVCSVCNNRRLKIESKREFSYLELYTATQGFSAKNFLSEGGFGSVYKGQLDGMPIAVKQHKSASFQGEKEFRSEVNVLRRARHENVVMLLGSCSEGNNRLLVYEYVCNGSLDQHLSEHSRSPLTWEDRIKIAIGAAKGLLYLHKNSIIHRDVRPNNILVTHDLQPLIGDFGLARTHNNDLTHSTEVVGTWGYLAPEYAEYGKVSSRTDVYSFGVVLLQLITGMRTTDKRLGGRSLVGWARPLLKERNYPDLIDERIIDTHDYHQLFWMIRLAEKCLSRDPKKRLTMDEVVNALTDISEGNTCDIGTGDYTPAMSDSSYTSEPEFDENEDENEPFEDEGNLLSTISESTEGSDYTIQMRHMSVRQPPSPPIKNFYSSGSSSFQFSDESNSDYEAHNEKSTEISKSKVGLINS
ncbi:probable serine/threonine-protein kinase PBL5 isoform X2 [Trifolium pratense]|uniref:probable serine/threonine-protein kinase PBL5 isoform X2 n=2 Tax=Trifolium pratense TaxID=57577 RepID=UPI001E692975|nr:probable serine/threonine-protein kinase PBL5 isoform X2 [Trifolium pratense]